MKFLITVLVVSLSLPLLGHNGTKDPNLVVEQMLDEIQRVNLRYTHKKQLAINRIAQIDESLMNAIDTEEKVNLLIEKDQLKTKLNLLASENANDISKIRYLKGLQIIRLLYEKVLGLDHHFASVSTFSEINKIANPNQYPEFDKLKNLVNRNKDRKQGFDLTQILGSNTMVSVINTFSNMVVSSLSKEEKENELKNIDCILDFTLRMQNDLNTIYFETAFLQQTNNTIKQDIEVLFRDFTKPIEYYTELSTCRKNVDWNQVNNKLNTFLETMNSKEQDKKLRMRIDLEFPIDRLIQFITQYNNFINQGEQFYQKFDVILNSYENEKQCQSKLPIEYTRLKQDINVAIEKFNVAYKPVEINGSKMKEIIYGINEYD